MLLRMKSLLFKRIKNSRGETITETLVSLLIIALAMTMLASSIVAAAKVNYKVKDLETAFSTDNVKSLGTGTITLSNGSDPVTVSVYQTDDRNAYVYYEE